MKLNEFMVANSLKSEEDLRMFFMDNMRAGRMPVALYSCITCTSLLDFVNGEFVCPECGEIKVQTIAKEKS